MSYKHSELTREIINAFYQVYNTLGYGFLEKVYQNALVHELTKCGYTVSSNVAIKVYYDNVVVGEYVGLILNFGPKPQVVRKIYETARHHKQT